MHYLRLKFRGGLFSGGLIFELLIFSGGLLSEFYGIP